jgi:uncharacterized protein (TIGR03435 family)
LKSVQGPPLAQIQWEKLKGKVVILEYWNTTCGPCVTAIQHFNELADQFRQKEVVFLSVSSDHPDELALFLKRKPIKGWIAVEGPLEPTRAGFDIKGVPHTVVVDASGKIAAITHPNLLEARHIDELLAGKTSSLPLLEPYSDKSGQDESSLDKLAALKPPLVEVSIRGPFPRPAGAYDMSHWEVSSFKFIAEKCRIKTALAEFFRVGPLLVFAEAPLPEAYYDFTVAGPLSKGTELTGQFLQALKTAFDLDVQTNLRPHEAYTLAIVSTNHPGLQTDPRPGGGGSRFGGFMLRGVQMTQIASYLESALETPVIDQTGDTNRWSVNLHWEPSPGESVQHDLIKSLKGKLQAEVIALEETTSGQITASLLEAVSAADAAVLKEEIAKPVGRRFRPDPAKVIQAAREQLGLELKLVTREMKVVEIRSTKDAGVR